MFKPIFRTHLYKWLNTKGLFRTHSVQKSTNLEHMVFRG